MPTQNQPWLRAELIAAPETAPGAQLMIPADTVEFHDEELVFHHQGDIVYVTPRAQIRAITWLARQPNPETARRRAQWPNHGTRWTDEEREDLLHRLRAGHTWKAISHAHGRSRTGCQQEAVKQGWVDSETLRPRPELLAGTSDTKDEAGSGPETAADSTATEAAAPEPAPASLSGSPAEPEALAPALVPTVATPEPDRPRFPPHVPRQRVNPDPSPRSDPAPDSDPEAGAGNDPSPGPGLRFLSRAQSSLARATLGAYVNPPAGQPGTASGAT